MTARAAVVQSTKKANKGMWAEMQGNNGETKVLKPLLEPLAGTPLCAGTHCWNVAGTPLSALEPLLEPTFVRFWSFLGIQRSV